MPIPDDVSARETLRAWLEGDGPWLTVVGAPGIGKRRWLDAALGRTPLPSAVSVLSERDEAIPAGRVIAVDHRRHRHPRETVIEVGPLPRPAAIEWLRSEAERAGIVLAEADADALVERLGGHPLALGLVARRLVALSVAELLERLDAPPSAGADPLMHATDPPWDGLLKRLRAAIDGLPAPTVRTLAAAALFAGRFTVAELSAICGDDRLDAMQRLRDHSLIAGHGRGLSVSPVIRRFAAACLPPASEQERARHRAWRAGRAETLAALGLRGAPAAPDRIAGFEAELVSLLNGIPDDSDGIPNDSDGIPNDSDGISERRARCDAGLALCALYDHRRSVEAQRRVAAQTVRQVGGLDSRRRLAAHVAMARACRMGGDTDSARRWLDRAHRWVDPDGTSPVAPDDRFLWCHESCVLAAVVGDRQRALRWSEDSLRAARTLRDPVLEARAFINVGLARHQQHDLDGAVHAYSAAQHISRRLGATYMLSISALNVSLVDVWRGRLDDARIAGEEARAAFAASGDRRGEGSALNNLGMIALERGDLDRAEAHFTAAGACHDAIGFAQHAAYARLNRAEVALERGDRLSHDRLLTMLELLNDGHPDATTAPGAGPMNDRALALHLHRSRARSALLADDLPTARSSLRACRARMGDGVRAERAELCLLEAEVALAADDRAALRAALERADPVVDEGRQRARLRVDLLGLVDRPDAAERLAAGLAVAGQSLAVRRVLRVLWPRLGRTIRREARARLADQPGLCLDPPSHELRLPDGRWVSLQRRRLVWKLLQVLFEADDALAPDAVIAAVWPGEAIHPDAANNRLYNAVALLRKAGLAGALQRVEAGYRLDPALSRTRISAADLASPD